MNWAASLYESMRAMDEAPALWTYKTSISSYAELTTLIRKAQALFRRHGLQAGDHVLVLDAPGPRLYAAALAIASMGASILLVEPWMPVERINRIVDQVKPKVFWAPFLGQLWASRIREVRRIPHWIRPSRLPSETDPQRLIREDVNPDHTAILTFTSGTSGVPKGIPRSHEYLDTVIRVIGKYDTQPPKAPGLVIFPNVIFYQLSRGRLSYIVPAKWPAKVLQTLSQQPAERAPRSVVGGPAFLRKLIACPGFEQLEWIGVGGALLDCDLLEQAMRRFPKAHFELIYGSTEVEPVAHSEGRKALALSRQREYFQVVALGEPIEELAWQQRDDSLWVSGPHVTREYLQAAEADLAVKWRDEQGRIWHNMGDRIQSNDEGFWYKGRSFQALDDFELEQRIYWFLKSSSSFVQRNAQGQPLLVGEGIAALEPQIKGAFPAIVRCVECKIIRDPRHRSRIDRPRSLKTLRGKL